MTVKELSDLTGLSTKTITNFEKGRREPLLPTLRILSKVLQVPISYLGCFEKLPEHTLGQRIMKARLYHGLTRSEFAQALGVDVKTVFNWEHERCAPLPPQCLMLKNYLSVLDHQ
ncbi:MAG TPA: helix-turn-helix domain-containing protein [Firmicutes bacterium]|nr:helix-turn-helix domain-containing protein [Candidatus Fermentithermobacillaceae bacterium]